MQLKDDNWESLYVRAKRLEEASVSYSEIERRLSEQEYDTILVAEIVKHLRKTKYVVKRKNGLQKIAFGILFLIIGFLISCMNFHSNQSFAIVMYSFTTIGLLFIFWGLYHVVG